MSIEAAISSTKKTGSNTGGTSHSRSLNLDISAAFLGRARAKCSQSPVTAGEARAGTKPYNGPSRNNEVGCNVFVRAAPSRVVIGLPRTHLGLSATGSLFIKPRWISGRYQGLAN